MGRRSVLMRYGKAPSSRKSGPAAEAIQYQTFSERMGWRDWKRRRPVRHQRLSLYQQWEGGNVEDIGNGDLGMTPRPSMCV